MEDRELRNGYTTGSCAAAAVKAALMSLLYHISLQEVEVETPKGEELVIPILKVRRRGNFASAAVQKYAGDDPDVTNGISICVKVFLQKEFPKIERAIIRGKCLIYGGRGVGLVTKKGLQVEVGKSAINPGPQKMIEKVVKDLLQETEDKVVICIYIPEGRAKASQTYNPKMGVLGGISVLGSTGIVKAMSEEALKASMYAELKVLRMDKRRKWVIFAFGNYGKAYCEKLGLDIEQMIIISNFAGFMIESAVKLGFQKIILLGHIGKAIKLAGGIFHTHSRVADGRMEVMGANAFLYGLDSTIIRKILLSNTVEEACNYVSDSKFFNYLSNRIRDKIVEYSRKEGFESEVLLFSFEKGTLGQSDAFLKMVEECHE
ncbi:MULTISPECIES: cobalt-precorrin-5B (C(1))-methyltransferase CbiD [Fusobacterium]|uniref:Cobalt-precorrin-5B C(1)-methyltransferase n=1 Tax=Fusobacterium equinum TaxID=134605 RepID=A0A133NBK3_9FUSO|nr:MULTISPECIES: cobalt-precorrin-5B (C(1))-methyltransferase CbiD [Fusobacterium]AVQ16098.1 cobalamin biosynthesis protein CbiD [Fusobacterium gonidiaformans ATCC 25563]EFS28680.1 cobalamin biosynthesis protein CbiD [Fusobacterium gonidiaformans ATCC 25563]KXA13671.1 cobalamin biosynthesis protein CbiD [Fusobacterium equinum]